MSKKMANKTFRGTPIALSETLDGSNAVSERVQLLRVGTFYHDKYGKIDITEATLSELKTNFDSKVRGIDIAIDFSHKSEDEAAGWVKSVEIDDDGKTLWGTVDWTPTAIQKLSEKQFRYISSNFNFKYVDNETQRNHGAVLLGAGLTNRPVVKGMAPVVELSEYEPLEVEIEVEVNKEQEQENINPQPEGDQMEEKIKELEAMIAQLKAENAQLKSSNEGMMGEKKQMGEKVASMEAALAEAKKENEFNVMLSEGKVVESQRDAYLKGDMKAFVEGQKELNLSENGHGQDGKGEGSDNAADAQDQVLALAEKKIQAKECSDFSDAISMVLSENADLRKKYESEVAL